jgi:hypothetical protein
MFVGIGMSLVSGRATSLLALYAVLGIRPKLAFDFTNERYFTGGSADTFSGAIAYTGASNKTMVDSDGFLKWAPHNLLSHSEQFDDASWTKNVSSVSANTTAAPNGTVTADTLTATAGAGGHWVGKVVTVTSGVSNTLAFYVKAGTHDFVQLLNNGDAGAFVNFDLSDGSVGNTGADAVGTISAVGNGWYLVEAAFASATVYSSGWRIYLTPSAASVYAGSFTALGTETVYIWGAHLYRSDLGGMVDNPDRGDSYVPTTTAAVYLPRRGHHVYNGSAWVNEGLLVESEARTNLLAYSQNFADASWTKVNTTVTANAATAPDGETSGSTLAETVDAGTHAINASASFTSGQAYTFSVFAKKYTDDWCQLVFGAAAFTSLHQNFNLATGAKGGGSGVDSSDIQDVGGGWYRISITATATATASAGVFVALTDNADSARLLSYTGDGTSGIYIWGAQVE